MKGSVPELGSLDNTYFSTGETRGTKDRQGRSRKFHKRDLETKVVLGGKFEGQVVVVQALFYVEETYRESGGKIFSPVCREG